MPLRFAVTAAACAALWLAPVLMSHAQDAAPAALPPPIVDPAARDLFLQMAAAQKALHSFEMTVDTEDRAGGKVVPGSVGHLQIAFDAPARASVTLTQQGKILGRVVCSGTVLSRVDMRHQSYREDVLPPSTAAGVVADEVGNLGLLPHAFVDPGGLSSLLSAPGLVALARGPAAIAPSDGASANTPAAPLIGGTAVDTVVARLVGADGQFVYTFAIGHTDHLLRQATMEQTAPATKTSSARSLTHRETVTELSVNPSLPASTFAFKPPAGFKKVTGAR